MKKAFLRPRDSNTAEYTGQLYTCLFRIGDVYKPLPNRRRQNHRRSAPVTVVGFDFNTCQVEVKSNLGKQWIKPIVLFNDYVVPTKKEIDPPVRSTEPEPEPEPSPDLRAFMEQVNGSLDDLSDRISNLLPAIRIAVRAAIKDALGKANGKANGTVDLSEELFDTDAHVG